MDPDDIEADATGDSVTAARLEETAVSALDDEQPHHLLLGQSLDVSGGENTERMFPSVDGLVSLLATDRRLLFVVPKAVGTRTEAVAYDGIERLSVAADPYPELAVETDQRTLTLNAEDDEPVEAVRQYVENQRPSPDVGTSGRESDDRSAGRTASGGPSEPVADGPQDGAAAGDTPETEGDTQPADDDPLDKLERLADLHDRGAITDEEFEARKADLLDRI